MIQEVVEEEKVAEDNMIADASEIDAERQNRLAAEGMQSFVLLL